MGDFADNITKAEESAEVARLRSQLDDEVERRLRAERMRDEANRRLKRAVVEKADVESRLDQALSLKEVNKTPARWLTKSTKGKKRHGTPTIFLSDTHWSEVVNPDEIQGYNAYNTEIAIKVTDMVDLTYDGVVATLGGDMFSGRIHPELDRTNDMSEEEAIIYWTEQVGGYLVSLADHFGKVHVPAFVGNHGRHAMDRKMPGKQRARTNKDWLLYQNLALMLKADSRITWQIAEGSDVIYDVYDTTYLGYHGNDFSGGNGISGIFTPVMLGKHRTESQYKALGRTFNYMYIGHFHQHIEAKGLIVNGTMKGLDEFAFTKRYLPERPSQAMWITTPENGLTFSMPIFCQDAKAEGWAVEEVAR
jgi:hypothetical protein